MKSLALAVALLFTPVDDTSAVAPVSFQHIGGPDPTELLDDRNGGYVVGRRGRFGDTLLVWIEHVPKGGGPDYESASHADLVVWCHPQENPHPRHALPRADGLVGMYHKGSTYWIGELEEMADSGVPVDGRAN